MKNEPLPLGQITPVAKPIDAFAAPGKRDVAGAAKPTLLGKAPSIVRQQKMQIGNVRGFNNFRELEQALSKFTPTVIEAGKTFHSTKKLQDDDIGFQEVYNFAKNQSAKALINLQNQTEYRATKTAELENQYINSGDSWAAQLLATSNPDKLAGRRRALSMIAASELDDILEADLANNKGFLSTLKPGSGEILKRKSSLTRQLQAKYGLSGDEPEYVKYFVTELNKSWDKYTDKQEALYDEEVYRSTIESTVALFQTKVKDWSKNGIPVGDGEAVMPGNPLWATLGGDLLTHEIDKQLSLLGGKKRTDAIAAIREQLVPVFGMHPGTRELMGFVRGGSSHDNEYVDGQFKSFGNRPLWKDLAPWDMLDMTNKGLNAIQALDENVQNQGKISILKAWWGENGPGFLKPDTPEYQQSIQLIRQMGIDIGYREIDQLIANKTKAQRFFFVDATAPTGVEVGEKRQEIALLGPEAFDDENRDATMESIKAFAARMPTRTEQERVFDELSKAAIAREKFLAKLPPDTKVQINRALKIDLGRPEIQKLTKGGSMLERIMSKNPMLNLEQAVSATGDQKLAEFLEATRNGMTVAVARAINKWYTDNPDAAQIPADEANIVTAEAIAEYRNSAEYKELLNIASPPPPKGEEESRGKNEPPRSKLDREGGDPGERKPSSNIKEVWGVKRQVGKDIATTIPNWAVKSFRRRALMKGDWLYEELGNLRDGRSYSSELIDLSKRANTTPDQFLLDQLKFYDEKLDPNGDISRFIQDKMLKDKQAKQLAIQAHYMKVGGDHVKNRHWGNWIFDILLGGAAYGTEHGEIHQHRSDVTVDRPLDAHQYNQLLKWSGGREKINTMIKETDPAKGTPFDNLIEHQYIEWGVMPDVPFEERHPVLREQIIRQLSGHPLRNESWGLSNEEMMIKRHRGTWDGDQSFDPSKLGVEIGQVASTGDMKGLFAKGPTPPPPIEPEIKKGGTGLDRWNTNWPTIYEIAKEVGIKYPEVVAAQFGQESKWGNLETGKNNYLGIKATQEEIDNGQSTLADTWEEIDGKRVKIKAHFKNFDSIRDSLLHYKKFWNDNYKDRKGLVNAKTREEAVHLLKANGYATDSKYVKAILEILKNSRDPRFGKALY